MREWCFCGAAIHAPYRRVTEWRAQHHCPDRPAPDTHITGGAMVEHAGTYEGDRVTARIGFRLEETP